MHRHARSSRAVALTLALVAAGIGLAGQRVWTDASGKFQVTAELVEIESDRVVLKRDDDELIEVGIEQLSAKDRAYLKTQQGKPRENLEKLPEGKKADANQPGKRANVSARDAKETALAFFEGLREPTREAALAALTSEAQELNEGEESALATLPTPDPGPRSVLVGRAVLDAGMAEVPIRVRTGPTTHNTRLHLRVEDDQWKVFAISATYPDGEKSINFEATSAPASAGGGVETLVGKPFPLRGFTLTGQPLDMAYFQDKVVLIDFWATWCAPCRKEMPNILANYQQYHEQGFEVVAISIDRDLDALRQYVVENGLPWTVVADKDPRSQMQMASHYGVRSIPTFVLLDRDGNVAAVNCRGQRLGRELENLL